ncbi:MAG: universal stress protein [Chthoniobacterales bacterium]
MKTLLVAIDQSEAMNPVLHTSVSLARQLGAKLDIIHVVEPIVTNVPIGAAMDVIEVAPPLDLQNDIQLRSEQLNKRLATIAAGIEFSAAAIAGMPVDEIMERAKTIGADFIILGSHGHGAIYHLFVGSVVTAVLKRSEVPVMVVPIRKH